MNPLIHGEKNIVNGKRFLRWLPRKRNNQSKWMERGVIDNPKQMEERCQPWLSIKTNGRSHRWLLKGRNCQSKQLESIMRVGWGGMILAFWKKHFPSIKKWVSTPFRQTFWPDKWDFREWYGGPNLGEKGFQLFQLL